MITLNVISLDNERLKLIVQSNAGSSLLPKFSLFRHLLFDLSVAYGDLSNLTLKSEVHRQSS